MEKMRDDLMKALQAALDTGEVRERVDKGLHDLTCDISEMIEWAVKEDLARNLAWWVHDMAKKSVEAILRGSDDELRRYLSCERRAEDGTYTGWTGRSDWVGPYREREPHEHHPVIHGHLFENSAVSLRRQVVDAHPDLLKDERVRDLEDQVTSLVAQVTKLTREKEELFDRSVR